MKRCNSSQFRCSNRSAWNQKNLDYEIETVLNSKRISPLTLTWNQKNLDYEIETGALGASAIIGSLDLKSKEPRLRDWNVRAQDWGVIIDSLEIKRTSITRLKQSAAEGAGWEPTELEIKRTSITRLKLGNPSIRTDNGCSPWNQKNLDYEIETALK